MAASSIPSCPVCDAIDDCRHCLVEWHGWPGQRYRGVLLGLIDRIEASVADLLTECVLAKVYLLTDYQQLRLRALELSGTAAGDPASTRSRLL